MADTALPPDYRVNLTTRNGSSFTGRLHSIDETSGKIVLTSVTTAGSKLCGPQNFYMSDLINCFGIGEDGHPAGQDGHPSREDGQPSRENKHPAREDGHAANNNDYCEGDGYILICDLSDKFYDVIVYIMEQNVVGVTLKGVNIGRDGTLSLIQIATDKEVFIFDILRLGKRAFDEGLQAVFETSSIVKVIHDCRWISDMLAEKYNISLASIFDTQVANAFVFKSMHAGDWPQYVESLPCCLVKHLNLPERKVNFKNVKLSEGSSVWLQRPLSANFLSAESRNVSYLIQLYQVLINKMLSEFRMGVEIYMNHVKTLNGEIALCRKNGSYLPHAFLEIPKLVNNSVRFISKGPETCGADKPAGKGRPADFRDYKQDVNNNKHRRKATHTPTRVEEKTENVLATEINHVSLVKPSSDSSSNICRSKLWQAVHAKQSYTSPQVMCELNTSEENSDQQEIHAASLGELDVMRTNVCDEIQIRESFKKLADLHFYNPEKSPMKNSSFENYEFNISPVTPHQHDSSSSLNTSFTHNCLNSVTESSLAMCMARDNVHETELGSLSFLPAGCAEVKLSKRKIRDLQKKHNSRGDIESNETTYLPTLDLEDDLGCIPIPGSLTRLQEQPLGATFGIGDLFSKTEYSIQQSINPQSFIESHLACNDETDVEDTEIENTRESKILQEALKLTTTSSDNLRYKLLPPKTSPSNYNKH